MANCCEHGECDRILTLGELKGMFDLSQIYVDGQLVSFNSGTSASWAANSGKCVTYKDITNGSYYSGSTEIKMGLSGTTPTPFYFPTTGETTDGSGFDITTGYSNVTYAYTNDSTDIKGGEGCCSAITDAVRTVDFKIVSKNSNGRIEFGEQTECNIPVSGFGPSTDIIFADANNDCEITSSSTAGNVARLYYKFSNQSYTRNVTASATTLYLPISNYGFQDGVSDDVTVTGYTLTGSLSVSAATSTTQYSPSITGQTSVTGSNFSREFEKISGCIISVNYDCYDDTYALVCGSKLNGELIFQPKYGQTSETPSIDGADIVCCMIDGTSSDNGVSVEVYGEQVTVTTNDFQNDYGSGYQRIFCVGIDFKVCDDTFKGYIKFVQNATRLTNDIIWDPCCDGGGAAYIGEKALC